MKVFLSAITSLLLASVAYALIWMHTNHENHAWNMPYSEYLWVSLILYPVSLVFSIYVYFGILRTYSARRRKAMEAPCTVLANYAGLKRQMERIKHGMPAFKPAPAAVPPPLPAAPPRIAVQGAAALREELKTLQQMKDEGLINEDEFAAKKSEVLKRF